MFSICIHIIYSPNLSRCVWLFSVVFRTILHINEYNRSLYGWKTYLYAQSRKVHNRYYIVILHILATKYIYYKNKSGDNTLETEVGPLHHRHHHSLCVCCSHSLHFMVNPHNPNISLRKCILELRHERVIIYRNLLTYHFKLLNNRTSRSFLHQNTANTSLAILLTRFRTRFHASVVGGTSPIRRYRILRSSGYVREHIHIHTQGTFVKRDDILYQYRALCILSSLRRCGANPMFVEHALDSRISPSSTTSLFKKGYMYVKRFDSFKSLFCWRF